MKLVTAFSMLVPLLFLGCGKGAPEQSAEQPSVKPIRITVIPKDTSHEYWKTIHAGANKAQQEFSAMGVAIEINWIGPLRGDDRDAQIQVVENAISRKVDAIVLIPQDARALAAPAEQAIRSRIPIVVIDSPLNSSNITSYISTDNYEGGVVAANALAKELNYTGNVILFRYVSGSGSTGQREEGFLATIEAKHPGIKVISSDQYTGASRDSALTVCQNVINRFGSEVNGVFAPCEPITIAVLSVLRDLGKDQVKVIGFDSSETIVAELRTGKLHGMLVQDPLRMGYLGVKAAVDALQGRPVARQIDTGVRFVTRADLDIPEIRDLLQPPLGRYLNP